MCLWLFSEKSSLVLFYNIRIQCTAQLHADSLLYDTIVKDDMRERERESNVVVHSCCWLGEYDAARVFISVSGHRLSFTNTPHRYPDFIHPDADTEVPRNCKS